MDPCMEKKHRLADLSYSARSRGVEIQNKVCSWAYRWGFVTDKTLEAIHPGRPRLGYDLWKKGLLRRHQVPAGIRLLDGQYIYSLGDEGLLIAEKELQPFILSHQRPSERPAWLSMQHLLDLQRIAVALDLTGMDSSWRTEPETRASFTAFDRDNGGPIPDLIVISEEEKLTWVEWDRSPKNDLTLDHWSQMLARRQARALDRNIDPKIRPHEISRMHIIVPTEYQRERYGKTFRRKVADYITRDQLTRKLVKRRDTPRTEIQKFLGDITSVHTLSDFLWP